MKSPNPKSEAHCRRVMWRVVLGLVALLFSPWPAYALPPAQDFTTLQGVRVVLVEEKTLPMVHAKLVVRAGSAYDPEDRPGVAAMTAWLLNEGAGELESKVFQEKLDFHGIRLGGSADEDYILVTLTTLADQLEVAFQLLGLVVTQPRFDQEPFDRGREHYLADIAKRQESPGSRAAVALREMIYGKHPYSRPVDGYQQSMESITREEVRQFHQQTFRGPEMVLVVAGDISRKRLTELLDSHFSAINPAPNPQPAVAMVEYGRKGSKKFISMDAPQSALLWGGLGIDRHDPDFYPAIVMNHILGGGGFSSRLMEEIREKRGLTYGVYSYFDPLAGRGPFVISMQTKTKSVQKALSLLRKEVKRMTDAGVTDQELETAKLDITGSFPLRLDGLGGLTQHWAMIAFYNRGMDFLDKYVERVNAVTREEVLRVARRLLKTDTFHQVVVGRKNDDKSK